MRLEKQRERLPVYNVISSGEEQEANEGHHGQLLPDNIRALICGSSGSGKTKLIACLLLQLYP
uniref:Uncharacterized protein n=1 Tax=Rhodnius prolixus TaxID=13249 RepID=T1I8C5_RHOPR